MMTVTTKTKKTAVTKITNSAVAVTKTTKITISATILGQKKGYCASNMGQREYQIMRGGVLGFLEHNPNSTFNKVLIT